MNAQSLCRLSAVVLFVVLLAGTSALAQKGADPERFRGVITAVEGDAMVLQVAAGRTVRLEIPEQVTVFVLSKASFADVDFGTYVGAVSEKLGDEIYSPIVRDSLSWLHKAYELRIVDESLRGIAVGHTKWDLTATSVMTHGWVDDREERVISIKYGPTDEEETDVEVPRDVPVFRMSRGDRTVIRTGARVFAGAHRIAGGRLAAAFIFIGKEGLSPRM